MAPQSGQGKKESVVRNVIQLCFSASKAVGYFHVSERTTLRWVQNYRRSGIFGRKAGSGRWKISTPEQDARLVTEAEGNSFHTAASVKAIVHFPGHEQTLRNRLRSANLRSRRTIHREIHKEEHIEERLVFAVGNDDRDWKKYFFLTKSPFLLERKDPLLYIVRLSDSTTDTPPFVPEVVECLCRVGVVFSSWNGHSPSHSREIQPAKISTVAGMPYGSLC